MANYSANQDFYDPNTDPNNPNKTQPPTQSVDYSGYATGSTPAPIAPAGVRTAGDSYSYTPPPLDQNTGINGGAAPYLPAGVGSSTNATPTGTYDRNAFRDAWMGGGQGHSTADLATFVNQHQGDFGAGVRILPGGKGDRIMLPDGSLIDAVIGAGNGTNQAGWTGDPSQMGGGVPPAGVGTGGQLPPNVRFGDNPNGAGGGSGNPNMDSLLAELQARANQSLNINAATDPNIRQQADPYAANLERQRRQYLNSLAESQGANANLTNEARLTAEQTGQQAGQYEGGLVGNEIQARRQEIQDALSQMGGLLNSQQQMALQKELADLNAATQRYGIDTQARTSANMLSNDWQKALLQNDQFNNRLGLDAENDYNNWNHIFTS